MKKLMMAVAIVCAAVGVQASSVNWKTTNQKFVYNAGTSTKLASATAYLFDAAVVTQSSLVDALQKGTLNLASYTKIDTQSISSGKIAAATGVSYGTTGTDYSLYFATLSGDKLFISDVSTYKATSGSETATMSYNPSVASKNAALDAEDGYAGSAWYAKSEDPGPDPTPEPTSAMLMLLGMAGLALRRKQK